MIILRFRLLFGGLFLLLGRSVFRFIGMILLAHIIGIIYKVVKAQLLRLLLLLLTLGGEGT